MKQISIRWKILLYILTFVSILLITLWFFQTEYLDVFYRSMKLNDIKDSVNVISKHVDKETLPVYINKIYAEKDVCVLVLNSNGVITKLDNTKCAVNTLSDNQLLQYWNLAKEDNDNEYITVTKEHITIQNPISNKLGIDYETGNQDIVFAKALEKNGYNYVIFSSTRVNPIDSTISTLKYQLSLISIVFVIFAIILAFALYRSIVRPLSLITEKAKQFGKGNFQITFDSYDFLEVANLSDTLNYSADKIKESDKLKKDLIANVSHDLRTPLTMIKGYAEMMIDLPSEKTDENIQVIISETSRLNALVDDLLELNKIQNNQLTFNDMPFNLNQCIQEILFRYRKYTDNFCFKYEFDEDVIVLADKKRIQQVIINLLNNAIHYSETSNDIIIRQTIKEETVLIEIIDHGKGISQDKLINIWDRYYKIDSVHKRSQEGSGIGLSIVKGILEQYKVQYGVTSIENVETNFYFELPLFKE